MKKRPAFRAAEGAEFHAMIRQAEGIFAASWETQLHRGPGVLIGEPEQRSFPSSADARHWIVSSADALGFGSSDIIWDD